MDWTDEGVVLSLRRHGESAGILEAFTRQHGRHLGLVYGGASSKKRAVLQPGNKVKLGWRARLSDHLGVFTAEPLRARASDMFERRASLIGLNAFTAIAGAVLPEREPHGPAFEAADLLLEAMAGTISGREWTEWVPLYVRWELGLLEELGFGLDLSCCVSTGSVENLAYVSPRSGRAVSAAAGEPYRDRLIALPAFLLGTRIDRPTPPDLVAGLKLTAYFLEHWVLGPHLKTIPEARRHLDDLAAREAAESA